MNKKLFSLAIAALGLAACSNDDVVEINQSLEDANTISFRPFVTNVTRAAADANLNTNGFVVTAFNNGGSDYASAYIKQETFTGTIETSFTSAKKYYWPSTGTLDFYAYSPSGATSQITYTAYNTFTVTPAVTSETAGDQVDLIYAAVKNVGRANANTSGQIPLNFRHAGAKIALKVTHANSNTAKSLKFKVKAWAVGYLDNSATFTFPDYSVNTTANTTDHNDGSSDSYLLPASFWTNNTGYATDKQIYRTTALATPVVVAGTASEGIVTNHTFAEEMILIPQTGASVASTYDANTTNSEPNGTFVAVKLSIEDVNTNTEIVPETWAMWPASVSWVPGKKYTYNVQLDEGGYYENNPDNDNNVLDPIFKGAVISFATVTVDEWRAAAVDVPAAPGSGS